MIPGHEDDLDDLMIQDKTINDKKILTFKWDNGNWYQIPDE